MNDENLIPLNKRSPRERKEISKKGAEATNKKKAEKKAFKEIFETLMQLDIERFTTDEEVLEALALINPEYAQKADVKSVISARVLHKALKGDMYAIGFLRDTIGEQPTQKQEISGEGVQITFNRNYE